MVYLDVSIGHVLVDAIDEELAALLCHDPVLSALRCRLAVAGTLAFYCDAAGRQSRLPLAGAALSGEHQRGRLQSTANWEKLLKTFITKS